MQDGAGRELEHLMGRATVDEHWLAIGQAGQGSSVGGLDALVMLRQAL
jgi:hypothetical protein